MRIRMPIRAVAEWTVLAALLTVLVLVLAHRTREPSAHPLARVDAAIYDRAQEWWAQPPREDVVVVAIDDDSLAQIGRWPWRRAVGAHLVERIQAQEPRILGVDLLLTEPTADDERLAAALASGPAPVVLPVTQHPDRLGHEVALLPVPVLGTGQALAHVDFAPDADGLIRGLYRVESGFAAMAWVLASPERAARPADEAILAAAQGRPWTREQYLRLGALSRPVPQVSAAALMRGEVPPDTLRGRIVLLGATARGLGDAYRTTLYTGSALVPGVALHAAAVSALLDDRVRHVPPPPFRPVAFVAILLLVLAVLYRTEPRTGLAVTAASLVAVVLASVAAVGAGWWVAPGALLVPLALAFPLWSWRRLHAASAGLMAQAIRLETDPASAVAAERRGPVEPIARRLQRLEGAADRIRDLNRGLAESLDALRAAQQEREQTLRFLSHDLRTPHLSILGVLQRNEGSPIDPYDARLIERQSRRALALTDGFMQLARAESQALRLEPYDLADLITEATDACWERATARGVRIVAPPAADADTVCPCDPGLVRRALVNLIDNAVRHSPPGESVEATLERDGDDWRMGISDRGPGIAAADRERVFEPWWRGESADPDGGAGLGLAFVAAVADRHGGRVRAMGRDDGGARLELWIPTSQSPALEVNFG